MKKLFTTILTITAFVTFAQAPQGINYQGVARNATGVVNNQFIGLQFKIYQGSSTNSIYEETHNPQTNLYGLFTATIGKGTGATSTFSLIPWANGSFFIETLIDPAGGTTYASLGKQQLMSVPYALYAEKAGNSSPTPTITINSPNTATMTSAGVYSINILTTTVNTYSLVEATNVVKLIENGGTTVGSFNLPASVTYTAGNGIDITGGVISNTLVPITPTITSYSGNITVTPVGTNSFVIDAPTYSITGTNTNTIVLTNGVNSSTVVIPTSASTTPTITGQGLATVTPIGASNNYTISVPSTSLIAANTNIQLIPNANLTSYQINAYSYTLASNSNSITIGNGVGGTSNTVSVPTYSLASNSNSITIYQNGTAVNTATLALTATTSISQGTNNNIALNGTAPNFTISASTYSLSFPTYSTSSLTNGTNTTTATVPSPPVSYTNGVLSVGNTTASIPALWKENSGSIVPVTSSNNLVLGTATISSGGKFEIEHNASTVAPTIHLKQPTAGALNRVKISNNIITGKFFEIAGGTNTAGQDEAITINYFNSANTPAYRTVFQLDGNKRIGINPLETVQGSLHIMEDLTNITSNGMMISEGFGKAGQLILTSNNPTGTFPAYTRGAVPASSEIGKLIFAGSTSATTFADGAKIYAKSAEPFAPTKSGTDLFFATTPIGTNSVVDRMVILNNGNVGIGTGTNSVLGKLNIGENNSTSTNLVLSNYAANVNWNFITGPSTEAGDGKSLTIKSSSGSSDFAIVASTNNTVNPFIKINGTSGNVGVGITNASSKLHIQNTSTSNDGLYVQDYSNGASLKAIKYGGFSGSVAYFQNIEATNNFPVVDISSSGTGKAINASITSSLNPTIFAKNSYQNTVAGDFDGGLKAYNSGTIASVYAFKASTANGSVGIFENLNANNSLSTLYANTNATSSVAAVAELSNTGTGSAINASSNSNMVATINAKNSSTITNAVAGFFEGGIISKASTNSSYAFQVQGSSGISDYLNVLSNGNVGIGVTSPGYKLSVIGTSITTIARIQNNGTGAAIEAISGASSNNALILNDGHIKSTQTNLPIISTPLCNFTSTTNVSYSGNYTDVKGSVLVNISSSPTISLNGYIDIKIQFDKSYNQAPTVVVTPMYLSLSNYIINITNSNFTVRFVNNTNSLGFASVNNFQFNYIVIE